MDTNWTVRKIDVSRKALEAASSAFTISNGYLAIKGNLLERHGGRFPTTIVAGVFDQSDMIKTIPPSGRERRWLDAQLFDDPKPCPSVAVLPDPLFLRVFIDGRELEFDRGVVTGFAQEWDLQNGVYSYDYDITTPEGPSFHIRTERFACMGSVHRAAMRYAIRSLNYSGPVTVRSGIDSTVRTNLLGEKQYRIRKMEAKPDGSCYIAANLPARDINVDIRVATTPRADPSGMRAVSETDRAYAEYEFTLNPGQEIALDKFIVIATTEDERHGVICDACGELAQFRDLGYAAALAANLTWWSAMWDRVDVEIEGDDLAQRYLRFCIFHLVCAAPRHTDKLSVPCKLLTGEWYQGSVFYDTDLYILPFYTFAMPEIARGCLNYRYLGLEPGRAIAKQQGYAGAKLAWQAGPYGEEVLAPWYRFVHTNVHIDSDVCHALDLYRNATGDGGFMREKGLDILVESARFYASRAILDGGVYHLNDVSGPDEGHCESTDNFYTNTLAAQTLRWAAGTLDKLAAESQEDYTAAISRLNVGEGEPDAWRRVANGLRLIFDPATKVYEQYEGYHTLKPIPEGFRDGQKEWWFTVYPYQAIHQPDVVMAMILLREDFPDDVFSANQAFYRDKSMDFSSMSHVIHCLAAKDIGDMDDAHRQFIITAGEDLDETLTGRGDTADGMHGTATGGAWMAAAFGFGGLRLTDAGLTVNPRLPAHWTALRFNIWLRGERLRFEVTQTGIRITVGKDASLDMPVTVCGHSVALRSGKVTEVAVLPPSPAER